MTAPVTLPQRLDSAAAVVLARTLVQRQGADVVLDAAGVDLLGAKAMQTLLVAEAAWRKTGHVLSVVNLSPTARGQLADLGLRDIRLLEGAAP